MVAEVAVTDKHVAAIDALTDDELAARLEVIGLSPFIVGLLVEDRRTVGATWRICQELMT